VPIPWMQQYNYPFSFHTEASINLAEDDELLTLMREAGFSSVFIGIETPDQDSLQLTRKEQNTRNPLVEACHKINEAGLLIYSGFIIGFDGERTGAGDRIQAFVEETTIPQPMLGLLQAPPNTALWDRLKKEDRLIENYSNHTGDANTLMNFVPTRPISEITKEYVETLWSLYEPQRYLKRCLDQCLNISNLKQQPEKQKKFAITPSFFLEITQFFSLEKGIKFFIRLAWNQGICRPEIRSQFWSQLWTILVKNPQMFGIYLGLCAAGEHFWEYRILTRQRIAQQLGYDPLDPPINQPPEKQLLRQSFS